MKSGKISDGHIFSSSSEASAIYAAIQGRLHFQETVDIAGVGQLPQTMSINGSRSTWVDS